MSAQESKNRSIIDVVGEFFAPLILAFESKEQLSAFVSDLGWKIEWNSQQEALIRDLMSADDLLEDLQSIWDTYQAEGRATESLAVEALELVGTVFDTVQHFTDPGNRSRIAQLPPPLSTPEDWNDLLLALPGYLVVRWLQINAPVVYEIGYFSGVIDEVPRQDLPPRAVMDWAGWGLLLSDPEAMVKSRFGWGDEFDGDAFLDALGRLMRALGLEAYAAKLEGAVEDARSAMRQELRIPLIPARFASRTGGLQPELKFALLSQGNSGLPVGVIGRLDINGPGQIDAALTDEWRIAMASPVLDPGELASFELKRSGVSVQTSTPQAALDIGFAGTPADPDQPWRLFGGDTGARLEVQECGAGLALVGGGSGEVALRANTAMRLVVAPGEGDSFIAEILGENELIVDSAIAVRWSTISGFAFEGGVGFEVIVPLDLRLGPIFVTQVRLGLEGSSDGLTFEGAISGGLDISVLAVSVDDIGLRASIVPMPEGERGMLGPVDLHLGFKPPKGIGMVINAADVVTGGGYLYHEEELGEYGGVAEIGFLSLKLSAIGILTTQMPDGDDGWSLFLSVFSEFPPIQLSFGFTLNGVGGLVGLHRTFDDEALRERLLAGALDSIMFPQDPIANAPQIIADIRDVFPPSRGQFVFGAMLKLGWGTPSIVTLELGVIVELPDPIKIALLGQLGMILPKPDVTLIEINMDMFGVANLTDGTLKLDAVIRDSHILNLITLSGAMAFRAEFGSRPNMLLSIGGFHPDFDPPANVPKLGRMKAALPLGRYAAVDLGGYVAVTSNSFQTGGHIDVWVKVAGLSAEGWFKFDALIQFSPFGFKFTTEIGFAVSFKGVTLLGVDVWLQVVGPAPWTLDGYAQVKIAGFKKKLNVDLELGKKKKVEIPSYNVAALLEEALADRENWGFDDEFRAPSVTYAKRQDGSAALDPRGALALHQKVAPLNFPLEKFGNGKVEGLDFFAFEEIAVGSSQLDIDYTDEWFARAEYVELSNDERVSSPSFEELNAGARLESSGEAFGPSVDGVEGFEEIIVDPIANRRTVQKSHAKKAKGESRKRADEQSAKSEALKAAPAIPRMQVRKLSVSRKAVSPSGHKRSDPSAMPSKGARSRRMQSAKQSRVREPSFASTEQGTKAVSTASGRRSFV